MLSPEKEKHETPVYIKIGDSEIRCIFKKDEEFIRLMKRLDCKFDWGSRRWYKEITFKTGNIKDRVAEIGYELLREGFSVDVGNDEEIESKIINADFEPEHKRWISVLMNTDEEIISFIEQHEFNDDLYREAKAITGAKWSRKFQGVKIPLESFKELEIFAEVNGFRFTEKAQNKMDELNETLKNKKIVKLKPKKEEIVKENGIIKDLIDDD